MEFITLIIGLAVGLVIAGLFLKKRISDAENIAQSKAQVELALLNERLSTATEEAKRLKGELTEAEQQRESQRQQLEASRNECAQLKERASRLAPLEQELKTALSHNEEQSQQVSTLQQKLAAFF